MKFSAALVAAVAAGLANAQSQCLSQAEAIPSCGQACLTNAGSSYGCVYTDFACQCSNSAKINNAALTQCVLSACTNVNDALAVSSDAQALCSCVATAAPASMAATSGSAIPSSTNAIAPTGAAPTGASATMAKQTGSSGSGDTSSLAHFTGGAAMATGSIGGLFAGILGLIAAL